MGKKSSKPKVTEEERALAKRGAQEFNDYLERYVPAENRFLELTQATAQREAGQRGIAQAEAAMGHANARQGAVEAQAAAGVAPSSGGSVFGAAGLQDAMAEGGAKGQAVAGQSVHDRELNAQTKMISFGRGLADQSSVGLRAAGRDAQQASLSASQRKAEERQGLWGAAATAAGMGVQYAQARPTRQAAGQMQDWAMQSMPRFAGGRG